MVSAFNLNQQWLQLYKKSIENLNIESIKLLPQKIKYIQWNF